MTDSSSSAQAQHHIPATFTILNFPVDDIDIVVGALVARGVRFERYDTAGITVDEKGIHRIKAPTSRGSRILLVTFCLCSKTAGTAWPK